MSARVSSRSVAIVALAVAVALAPAACTREHSPAGGATRDPVPTAPPPLDAAPIVDAGADAGTDASYADLGQLDPRFLDGVDVVKGGGTVDATSLGARVEVRVVERVTDENTGMPVIEILVVLSGSRTIAVEIGRTWDYAVDESVAPGTLILVADADPPAPWSADNDPVAVRLPSRRPMLYRFAMSSPGLVDSFAIVREKDALVAYTFFTDEGEVADAWETKATIRLPRGATLTFS